MLLTREQLQDRLIALHKASLELVKDVSLDRLLERIAAVACEQADARYAALGVLDENGKLVPDPTECARQSRAYLKAKLDL